MRNVSQEDGDSARRLATGNNQIFADTESAALIAGRQLDRPMSRRNGHLQQAGPPILVALVAQPDGRWSNLRPDQVVASPELTQILMVPLDGLGQDDSAAILVGFAILTSWQRVLQAATVSQGILLHLLASQHRRCGPCVFFRAQGAPLLRFARSSCLARRGVGCADRWEHFGRENAGPLGDCPAWCY